MNYQLLLLIVFNFIMLRAQCVSCARARSCRGWLISTTKVMLRARGALTQLLRSGA